MNYDKFLGKVQNQARLPTTADAVKATRATLEVLGQRLHGGEADDLASQLPSEIGLYLKQAEPSEAFDLDEFFKRVSQREDIDLPDAIFHSRAVISVLTEAVTPGEIEDVRAQLTQEYDPLFEAGSEGSM
jgi:uncharacterized protein (DUF2267 family)